MCTLTMYVLKVSNLTKQFTSGYWLFSNRRVFTAVNNISFSVSKNEILGFLGPNGAGKTTTIQMLLGTLTSTSGNIEYFGKNFKDDSISALKKIGYASGYDKLPARLSVYENLDIVARIYEMREPYRSQRIKYLLASFGLTHKSDCEVGMLSAGQATRVMLAKAFLAHPELVLLDEPTASLDPDIADEVRQFILNEQKEYGTAILITSHNMEEVTELCDRVLVLKNGSIIADNTPEELARSTSKAKINLLISSELSKALEYLEQTQDSGKFKLTTEGNKIVIELDEHEIAQFLIELSNRKITYDQISIEKPTLEDYFLSIAKSG